MKLEIDAGNTLIKWRCVSGSGVVNRGQIGALDELSKLFEVVNASQIESVLVSSVAGLDFEDGLLASCKQFDLVADVQFVRARPVMAGVRFAYNDINRLGVDRCLAMVAGYKRFPSGVLVIDSGSALTADFVDASGIHLGGYILPGLSMLERSLLQGTANVLVERKPDVDIAPGNCTERCVENGRYFMLKSLLFGLMDLSKEYQIEDVVIAGGDGMTLAGLLGDSKCFVRDLVFEGLEWVSKDNGGRE